MAEIIRPIFGRPKKVEPTEVGSTNSSPGGGLSNKNMEEFILADARYVREHPEHVAEVHTRIFMVTMHIFGLLGYQKKEEYIRLRQAALRSVSVEVLCSYLLDSSQLQWTQQPSYYEATVRELSERLKTVDLLNRKVDDSFLD